MSFFIRKTIFIIYVLFIFTSSPAHSFVGLFITQDGSIATSQNSKIVIARKDQKTILTFTSDFYTKSPHFLLIVPIPANTEIYNIHTVDYELVRKLDLYTSPRLIEYINFDPCNPNNMSRPPIIPKQSFTTIDMDKAIGLTYPNYTATNNYNFITLTLKESRNIEKWLKAYKYNPSAQQINLLKKYAANQMKFLIIEINNLNNQITQLMPIQIEYKNEEFVLPILMNELNLADSSNQNTTLFFLSNQGEVLPTNYKIENMPTGINLPTSVITKFNQVYNNLTTSMFSSYPNIIRKEYAWPMSACKPCTSAPLTIDELHKLGVFWYQLPKPEVIGLIPPFSAIYITRLHMPYIAANNIEFEETTNKIKYQTYFNIRHPIEKAKSKCSNYYSELQKAQTEENENLQSLFHIFADKY